MKNNRGIRLHVEELENRVVPSAGTPWPYPSGNWSGYSIESGSRSVSDVKGSWTVPTVNLHGSGTSYSASWVGIDGSNSRSVEQIGTDSDQVNGVATYYAWYEMYPAYPVYLSMPINKGDSITAEVSFVSISGNASKFQLQIWNNTTHDYFSTFQTMRNAARSSAEWIMEAPSSGGVLPLADFGSETFTKATAKINGITGNIGTFLDPKSTSTVVYKMDIASSYNQITHTYNYLDRTGELNSDGDFTVNFGKTDPDPPLNGTAKTYGSNNHLVNFQAVVASASASAIPPSFSSSAIALEISAATPGNANTVNPVLATPATVLPPEFRAHDAYFSQAGEAQTPFDDLDAGRGDGEGNLGAGLPWFGLPSTVAPHAVNSMNGNSRAGGPRFEASAEPVLSPGITPQATPAFLEGPQIERMIGALALVIALQGMQAPKGREQPAWPRRRPEKEYLPG